MLLESLREQVLHANQEIARRGLAPHTFGNASGIDRAGSEPLVVIKPSGVDYASLTPADLVVTDLDGKIVEGSLNPSSDLDTHTLLYREFPRSAALSTPTPSSPPPGRRPAARYPAWAPLTPTIFTVRFPSPSPSPPPK